MKKIIIVCGLIAGLIITALMITTVSMCYKNENFEGNMALGFGSMILAFSLIFVGIKNFRDKFNGGHIRFGQAFKIGILITLIASSMYVIVWLIEYYLFIPDFMDKYEAHILRQAQKDGLSGADLAKTAKDMSNMKEWYKNPVMVVLITFTEVAPVGLVITLISAFILKRNSTRS